MRVRRWIAPVVIAAALLTGCNSSDGSPQNIDTAAAQEIVADNQAIILDVRTPAEFAAGHLPNAVNVDVESGDFAARVSKFDEQDEYLVYCRTGNRSGVAVEQMADLGFTDLSNLEGGIEAWSAAGGQVVQ